MLQIEKELEIYIPKTVWNADMLQIEKKFEIYNLKTSKKAYASNWKEFEIYIIKTVRKAYAWNWNRIRNIYSENWKKGLYASNLKRIWNV